MKAIQTPTGIRTDESFGNIYNGSVGFLYLSDEEKENLGFRDVVEEPLQEGYKFGDLYYNDQTDKFYYNQIPLTDEEIQAEKIASSEQTKEVLMQSLIEKQIIDNAQSSSDEDSLDNQELFPFWEEGIAYEVDYKVQSFDDDNRLNLYKVLQAHTSQSNWMPKDTPALFTLVSYPGTIPVWKQPQGSHDAYMIGDQVYYPDENGDVYESLINANVWSPPAYPQGWQLITI